MKTLTPYDIADLLQVSYDAALEFIKNSGIAYIRIGRQYRVAETVFNAFVSADNPQTVKSSGKNIYNNGNVRNTAKLRRK